MGQTTPNISIYVPAAGETNYDSSFSSGMVNVDQHDHTGAPTKGVLISTTGLADGTVTYPKLNANVADTATGIGVDAVNPNKLQILGLLKELFQLGALSDGQLYVGKTGLPAIKTALTAGTGISIVFNVGAGSLTITNTGAVPGSVAQFVRANKNTFQACTTVIPIDDTIPPQTEGDEVLTVVITPKAINNILVIEFSGQVVISTIGLVASAAIFQDATSAAICAGRLINASGAFGGCSPLIRHIMTAGTVAATTFKVRVGPSAAGTISINGDAGSREFGGVAYSYLSVTEYWV